MSYLLSIETALPKNRHYQNDLATFYCNTLPEEALAERRKIMAVAAKSGIKQRYSVLPDFSEQPGNFTFWQNNYALEPMPGLQARMSVFKTEALKLSVASVKKIKDFEKIKSNITHIITVTCTGLFAPGLEIELIRELGLRPETERAPVNFMGCNAAMLALKQADYICKSYLNALVLIVCTEICTIHFQRDFSDDYIISNLTFGDGSSAALVAAEKKIPGTQFKPVKLRFFQSQVVYKGYDEMNWRITEKGFIMKLGSSVPDYLSENIGELLSSSGIQKKDIKHWAIHPGGKRVLECFASAMKLEKEDLSSSYHVLENYGNMSSVTIMFVLKHLLENDNVSDKDSIFAAAFGPGLTIEAAVMDYV